MLLRQFMDGARKRKSLSREKRLAMWKQAHGRCWYCGAEVPKTFFVLEHVEPVSKGGPNGQRNLVVSCFPCDKEKGARGLEEFRRAQGVDLFFGEKRRPMSPGMRREIAKRDIKRLKRERKHRMQREIRLVRMAEAFDEIETGRALRSYVLPG